MTTDVSSPPALPVAAVARLLGVAPATLRTWDRRYGIGPSVHEPGRHRRYNGDDLARLEALRDLVRQGVTVADAAAQLAAQAKGRRARAAMRLPTGPDRTSSVTSRQVREAALRLDVDRLVVLIREAVADLGVVPAWDSVVCPALAWLGERWETSDSCIAAEHVLSECVSSVLVAAARSTAPTSARPVLLVCAPRDDHVLPLHALAAALAEREVRTCVIGPATPVRVTAEAVRRLNPSGLLVWSQFDATADLEAVTGQPRTRAGMRVAAAGPGWGSVALPARVEAPADLAAAVALFAT